MLFTFKMIPGMYQGRDEVQCHDFVLPGTWYVIAIGRSTRCTMVPQQHQQQYTEYIAAVHEHVRIALAEELFPARADGSTTLSSRLLFAVRTMQRCSTNTRHNSK